MGIGNATVRAYDVTQGPGPDSIEVTTAPDGSYLIAEDDLSEATTIAIEASAPGYVNQTRNLSVTPGQTYEGEDFSLMTMPMPPMP